MNTRKKNRMHSFKALILTLALVVSAGLNAQDLDPQTIQEMVEDKRFTFRAETVFPMNGPMRHLTSAYDVRVSGDSLISHLPYFGRAYEAPFPGESGIRFQTVKFEFKAQRKKNDSWEIIMKPRNQREVREMILRIFENGYATLVVNSNTRQSISFNGLILKK